MKTEGHPPAKASLRQRLQLHLERSSTKWGFPMRRKEKTIVLTCSQRPRANRLAVGALLRGLLQSDSRLAAWLPRRRCFPQRLANS